MSNKIRKTSEANLARYKARVDHPPTTTPLEIDIHKPQPQDSALVSCDSKPMLYIQDEEHTCVLFGLKDGTLLSIEITQDLQSYWHCSDLQEWIENFEASWTMDLPKFQEFARTHKP